MKHFSIGAIAGDDQAMMFIRKGHRDGNLTKYEFERVSCAHKEACDEMKSEQRDKTTAIKIHL